MSVCKWHGSYGLSEPTSFVCQPLGIVSVGCFKNLLEKTGGSSTNTVTIQTKKIEPIKQAAKRPKPPLAKDGSTYFQFHPHLQQQVLFHIVKD